MIADMLLGVADKPEQKLAQCFPWARFGLPPTHCQTMEPYPESPHRFVWKLGEGLPFPCLDQRLGAKKSWQTKLACQDHVKRN